MIDIEVKFPVAFSELLKNVVDEESWWKLGNDTLYNMCSGENFYHTDANLIVSKVWLIGRAYSARIERTKANVGDVWSKLQEKVNRSEFDIRFGELQEKNIHKFLLIICKRF